MRDKKISFSSVPVYWIWPRLRNTQFLALSSRYSETIWTSMYSTNFLIRDIVGQDLHLHINCSFLQGLEVKPKLWAAVGTRGPAAPRPEHQDGQGRQDLSWELQPQASRWGQDEVWRQGSGSASSQEAVSSWEGRAFTSLAALLWTWVKEDFWSVG